MKKLTNTSSTARQRQKAWALASIAGEPAVTRPSSVQPSYVASERNKTHSGILHQSRTLETPTADKSQERRGTRRSCRTSGTLAGNQVEVSGAAVAAPVTTVRQDGESGRKAQPRVFVLGKNQQPLMPCQPARARQLLHAGRAVIHRRLPLVIRLKDRTEGTTQPVAVKLDPGATTTGIAIVRLETNPQHQHLLTSFELAHRGTAIRDTLAQRAAFRRSRRNRKTRYRAPRFLNRGGDKRGWLPPSLRHRLETTHSWVARLSRFAPVTSLAMEIVRFDTQALQNPEIVGLEYQQGELAGYEVREYLLEKWGRKCAYCDASAVPLQVEHITARSRGGSDRISNLTLACERCNQAKGARDIREFLARDVARLDHIFSQSKHPLRASAAVNATRFALRAALLATGLPVVTSTGGRTKFNRSRFHLPKTHALDAACVGEVLTLAGTNLTPLSVRCTGRGSRQRTKLTAHGFPRSYLSQAKYHFGFRTGDLVIARVPSGKKAGVHRGRVAVRRSGSFNIQKIGLPTVQGISHKHCRQIQRADGYNYHQSTSNPQLPPHPSYPATGTVSAASL